MTKIYIVVGNDGLPRYADPECETIYAVKSFDVALDTAKDMTKQHPYVVFGVYGLEASVFNDGSEAVVVPVSASRGPEVKN